MVIPPFAPPPYVDSSAYILPHPHIQPVDYRRLMHLQAPAPNAPYHNPNPLSRIRLPQAAPVRATVNSAVQTEPAQRNVGHYADGSPPMRTDSGHGTTSDSPSSSSSSSQKQTSDSCSLTSNHAKDVPSPKTGKKGAEKHGGDILAPVAVDVPSCIGTTVEQQKCHKASVDHETVPPYRNSHCNMWSVGSPDGIVPVCSSSQQEDEVVKERRVSFPDILMSWGGGTPKEKVQKIPNKVSDQPKNQLPKSVCESPSATNSPVALENSDVDDSGNVLCSKKCPTGPRGNEPLEFGDSERQTFSNKDLLHSLNVAAELEKDETILSEDPAKKISNQMLLSSTCLKGRMNESVWSVESLPPFVPTKELIFLKNNVDSEIIEMEEIENDKATKHDDSGDESRKRRSDSTSSSDSGPASTSWLDFTPPAQRAVSLSKKPEKETEPTGPKSAHVILPAERNPLVSITPPRCGVTPEVEENWFSEPEANRRPNQAVTVQEQSKHTLSSSAVGEAILQNGADPEAITCGSEECDPTSERNTTDGMSPSKGHMVDCAIQCTSLLFLDDEPKKCTFKPLGKAALF